MLAVVSTRPLRLTGPRRDIPAIIESAGMTIARLDTYYVKGQPRPYAAMYEGVAVGN